MVEHTHSWAFNTHWKRAIILVDMNAFFASIEQLDHPELQGRPIGITNGEQGTCLITCSYEARHYGIRTGMRVQYAKKRCPYFIQVPARPERYAQVSRAIMHALQQVTPDIEVFSVDEAFLDISHSQQLWESPLAVARYTQTVVHEASGGVLCSIGMSGDKTTAKFAAKQNKPNGLTIIPPQQAKACLQHVPVTQLCGISKGIGRWLAQRGVITCGDMSKLPIGDLARQFGNPGRRIWHMAQGQDPAPLDKQPDAPKSLGHGKIMPPDTTDHKLIKTYLLHMCEKLAARLRKHHLSARTFRYALRTKTTWLHHKEQLTTPSDEGALIYQAGLRAFRACWHQQGVYQIQITALDPTTTGIQADLFDDITSPPLLNTAVDAINQRYGEFFIAPARLLNRSQMPNVISPAWKPSGHRETIG